MRKVRSRTERLVQIGLSLDEATKVLIYYDQGLRWIKNIDYQDKLQDELDKFVDLLIMKSPQRVDNFIKFVLEKYFPQSDEHLDDEEFTRRWNSAYEVLTVKEFS